MKNPPKRGRSWVWVLAWSAVAAEMVILDRFLTETFWILPGLVELGWWIFGLGLLAILLFRRRWRSALILAVVGAGLILLWSPIAAAGDHVTSLIRLRTGGYQKVVAEAASLPDNGEAHGLRYIIDRGPPLRVAFINGGLLDNWSGFVHDPTDRVGEARGWGEGPGQFTAPPEIKGLFGGDMVRCDRITGHWYRCGFT